MGLQSQDNLRNICSEIREDFGGTSEDSKSSRISLQRPRPRRGAVLLMILVMIVVLSAVIVQFTEKALTEIASEGHYVERDRLRITAFSALEVTMAVLADYIAIEGGLTSPAQGWGDPLGVAGFDPGENLNVVVSFADESGKLPINTLDEGTLFLLFNEMGFDAEQSLILTNALLDWIDEDDEERIDGAESETYAVSEWPFGSSNRPVSNLEELVVVKGFREYFFDESGRPNQNFRTLEDTVSVWSDGSLNANAVSDLALRAYAGYGDPQLNAMRLYLAGADGIRGTEDDRYFASTEEVSQVMGAFPEGANLGVGISVLKVHVEVRQGDGRYALEAIVQPSQGGGGAQTTRPSGDTQPITPQQLQQQQRQRQSTQGSGESEIPYPFVFLELTEDVGHNQSISAPVEPSGDEERLDRRSTSTRGA